jgi:hypothetical protein
LSSPFWYIRPCQTQSFKPGYRGTRQKKPGSGSALSKPWTLVRRFQGMTQPMRDGIKPFEVDSVIMDKTVDWLRNGP